MSSRKVKKTEELIQIKGDNRNMTIKCDIWSYTETRILFSSNFKENCIYMCGP